MTEDQKPSLLKRILFMLLKSPMSVLFGVLLLYYGFQAFVLGNNPYLNKALMVAVVILWLLWFLFKNLFKLLLLAVVIALGAYGYYHYTHLNENKCEAQGGVWNAETNSCEEKLGWWQQIKLLWSQSIPEVKSSKPDSSASSQVRKAVAE